MTADRLKGPLRGVARAADPFARYRCMYRAKLRAQSGDKLRVDVEPDDKTLPPMSNIPLRHGIPGIRVSVAPGAYLLVGWADGSPDDPFAALWSNPGGVTGSNAAGEDAQGGAVLSAGWYTPLLELGGDGSAPLVEAAIIGTTFSEVILQLATALSAAAAALQGVSVGPLSALQPGFSTMNAALQTFLDQHAATNGFKSNTVKVAY